MQTDYVDEITVTYLEFQSSRLKSKTNQKNLGTKFELKAKIHVFHDKFIFHMNHILQG